MFFNITKQKSLALLQLLAAIFILCSATFMGELPANTAIYGTLILFSCVFFARVISMQKIDLSISHLPYLLLTAYAMIVSFWAGNREGNLSYFFALILIAVFHSLSKDYFNENSAENIKRRSLYLILISGTICSVINFFYWVSEIVPVAGTTPLTKGLGTNDFLGIFLYFSILAALILTRGNSKKRRVLLLVDSAFMLFVFILAKSTIAWIMAIVFSAIYLCRNKKKIFTSVSIIGILAFAVLAIIEISIAKYSNVLPDVLKYSIRNPFGYGGGFWSAGETFLSSTNASASQVGLFALLFASSGIIGALCCIFFLLKSLFVFIKLKNIESVAAVLLVIALLLFSSNGNIAVFLLVIGVVSYTEKLCGNGIKIEAKGDFVKKFTYALCAVVLVSAILFLHSMIKTGAKNAYEKESYSEAYSLYKTAGFINICDSESLRQATISLRKSGEIAPLRDVAVTIADRAIRRDRYNLSNIEEKGRIYDACGEFELSAQQYRDAVQKAANKDRYNLLLAKELYKIVKKSPKGSPETKRAYEEIIQIAQLTQDLDCKKQINDIADKAFKYTKGEFSSEEIATQ